MRLFSLLTAREDVIQIGSLLSTPFFRDIQGKWRKKNHETTRNERSIIRCCRAPQICYEYPPMSDLCGRSQLVVGQNACAGQGCTNTTLCCREPQACNELQTANNSFCQSFAQVWNDSDSQNFYGSCEGNCTKGRCCRPPTNCLENDQAYQNFSCPSESFKVNDPQITCTNCADECCATPQTCNELYNHNSDVCFSINKQLTTNATLLHSGCDGTCNADMCCVTTCDSVSGIVSCPQITPIFDSQQPCTNCSASECCRPVQFCGVHTRSYTHCVCTPRSKPRVLGSKSGYRVQPAWAVP